jgi:transposase
MKVTLIGIDLAKNVFQICGVNQAGNQVFNKAQAAYKLKNTKKANH